jgi:uncharacterized protein YcbX
VSAGPPVVTGLFVYPVKSCAGTPLAVARLGARGIEHDREFMLVDEFAHFLTQREYPRMALIRPTLTAEGLRLSAPGMPSVLHAPIVRGDTYDVAIWRDHVNAVDQGDAIAEWLGSFLGIRCRLVRQADDAVRLVDPNYATSPLDQVSFADGYPLLLISEESLADLNARLEQPLPMHRFRPNVVVRGAPHPYAEDDWGDLCIGDVPLSGVKTCARCVIPNTDQLTAERADEPLATLTRYRRIERGVIFGQNVIHHSRGTLRVGAPVTLPTGTPGPRA